MTESSALENISLARCQRELSLSAIPGKTDLSHTEEFHDDLSIALPVLMKKFSPALHPKIIFNDDENQTADTCLSNSKLDDEISAFRLRSDTVSLDLFQFQTVHPTSQTVEFSNRGVTKKWFPTNVVSLIFQMNL